MAKGKIINAYYRCQQAVVDKVGAENLEKSIKIGVKIRKVFKNSYDLMNYLYAYGQRNKFLWLEKAKFVLDVDEDGNKVAQM